jgi:virginiamycin B lyase
VSHASWYGGRSWMVCLVAGTLGVTGAGAFAGAGSPPTRVARIATGTAPCGAVSGFRSVWVAVYQSGRLVRIDPIGGRITRRIRVAPGICPVAIGAGSVWVASDKTNLLYRVDPRLGRVVARIRVAEWPAHVTFAFGSVWVSAYERGLLARIDPQTNRIKRRYAVGGNPSGMARAGGFIWIAYGRAGTALGRLDPASGALTRLPIGHAAAGFLSFIGDSLWTTTADGFAVRFDLSQNRVLASFSVPGTPAEVASAPDGTIWVAEKERNTITRIDPKANVLLDVTSAGRGAFSIAAAAGDMWVTNFAGADVWRFRSR